MGLTGRGAGFLGGGGVCTVVGYLTGQPDLVRLGVFVAVLPLAALLLVHRTRYRLSCRRSLDRTRVSAGGEATVTMTVTNLSRVPTGVLLAEDGRPAAVGQPARFVIDRVRPHSYVALRQQLFPAVRGRYRLGPLTVVVADPFGLARLARSFTAVDTLVVTPPVFDVPPVRLGGAWVGGGEDHSRAAATVGEEDVAPREYHPGDDLRRVHWRATARAGEIMVRREEQPWQSRAVVLLDARQQGHAGHGTASSFEWAVSAAASLGVALAHAGFGVRLLGDLGTDAAEVADTLPAARGELAAGLLLEALAAVRAAPRGVLAADLGDLRRAGEGVVVCVLGDLGAGEVDALARARTGSGTAVAVVLDVSAWSEQPAAARARLHERHRAALATLRAAGWRVVPVGAGDTLAGVWARLPAGADLPARVAVLAPDGTAAAGLAGPGATGGGVPGTGSPDRTAPDLAWAR